MGVACEILINKTKEDVHKAGQVITGIVKYALDKPTKYKAITLSLLGTGECSWTEGAGKNSTTYTGKEKFITIHRDLLNKEEEATTLDIGSYQCPFEFPLPEDLPSSYKDDVCTIKYRIRLTFVKPTIFSFNKKFITKITVRGLVEPTIIGPITFGLTKPLVNLFSAEKPTINLKADILETCLHPGEDAHLTLVVTNNTDIVPTVKASLYCYTVYTADCGHKEKEIDKIKGCKSEKTEIPKRGIANLSQTIPTNVDLYTITSKVIKKEYKLKVTVRLPMPYINAVVEMPVAIGERLGSSSKNFEEIEKTGSLESEESVEVLDAPPSYWEIMCEDKDDKYDEQDYCKK